MPNVVQGGREVQPGGILEYFEDLNRAPNAEFGLKDLFEMASNTPRLNTGTIKVFK